MRPQLIYLHIEKAAGSSQRVLLYENYGEDDVYWLGLEPGLMIPADLDETFTDRRVLGGHFDYPTFATVQRPLLFTAVVREPIARAFSLYYYCAHMATPDVREGWRSRGLVPSSMLRTLERCPSFLGQVNDRQNFQLSGVRHFEETRAHMRAHNFVVGCIDNLTAFNGELGDLLGWSKKAVARHNAGPAGYYEHILSEPGLLEKITELNREDQKLYNFIKSAGVFEHLPERRKLLTALAPKKT